MRRRFVFFLLLMGFTASLAACGGESAPSDPVDVVQSWSQAVNASDNEAAAKLFAPNAVVIQGGQRTLLAGEPEALAFNSALPCGAKLVDTSVSGDQVTASFTLTRRRDHMCDGTGESATTVFTVTDGKITLWHELPSSSADAQTA
jgi:limonene-1,2-epoxide hydrolase